MAGPNARSTLPYVEQACPLGVCDGSGWLLGPEDVARPCECREARLSKRHVRGIASVIPKKFRGVSFDRPPISDMDRDMKTRSAVGEVRKFVGALDENLSTGRGVWFLGDVGTGKTSLAMLISKTALEHGHSVAIYSMPKLLTRIRRTYDAEPGGDTYATFFERLTSVDLLHIDDLGAERQTEWVIEQLYSIVNERYESKRSIMFTTNTDKIEEERDREGSAVRGVASEMVVEKQIGRRTFSRLTEMCGDPIRLLGEDRRTSMPLAASDSA